MRINFNEIKFKLNQLKAATILNVDHFISLVFAHYVSPFGQPMTSYVSERGDICTFKGLFLFRRYCGKITVETLLHNGGLWSLYSVFEALLDKVELVAQRLISIRHTDLGHVGLADVITLWTLLKVVVTQEVLLLLANGSNWVESDAYATRRTMSG